MFSYCSAVCGIAELEFLGRGRGIGQWLSATPCSIPTTYHIHIRQWKILYY